MDQQQFKLGDRVKLAANAREGRVDALYFDAGGPQFRVEYADASGGIGSHWARPGELEPVAG